MDSVYLHEFDTGGGQRNAANSSQKIPRAFCVFASEDGQVLLFRIGGVPRDSEEMQFNFAASQYCRQQVTGERYHLKLCANAVWGGSVLNFVMKRDWELDMADIAAVPSEPVGRLGKG